MAGSNLHPKRKISTQYPRAICISAASKMSEPNDLPHEHPITWELDLHTFRPNEIGELIPEYLRECRAKGILHVRIIHGKGRGTLRQGVHHLLSNLPEITHFKLGDQTTGGWGATLAWLKPLPNPDGSQQI